MDRHQPRNINDLLADEQFWDSLLILASRAAAAEDGSSPAILSGVVTDATGLEFAVLCRSAVTHTESRKVVVVVIDPSGMSPLPSLQSVMKQFGLSRRRAEVALLLARRRSTKEIAKDLGISQHTARRHVGTVLKTLKLSRRSDVAACLTEPVAIVLAPQKSGDVLVEAFTKNVAARIRDGRRFAAARLSSA